MAASRLGGHAYRLRDSLLRFAPADGLVPTLDVFGETRIGDYDVTIRISGTPDRIETAFSSVPPLGERELQSLIVTGRADDQSTQGKQSDNFAAAAAATDILGFAGKFVGLDSVRIGAADLDLVSKDVNIRPASDRPEVARLVVRPDLFRQPRRWLGHVGARVEADPAQRDPSLVGRGRHTGARISPLHRVRARLARRSRERAAVRWRSSRVRSWTRFRLRARRDSPTRRSPTGSSLTPAIASTCGGGLRIGTGWRRSIWTEATIAFASCRPDARTPIAHASR